MAESQVRRLMTSRPALAAMLIAAAALALIAAVLLQAPHWLGQKKVLTDFDAFYVAGLMTQDGRAEETYQIAQTLKAQQALTGANSFMLWTYPPPYLLFVREMARLPIGFAYLLFAASSFVFYLLVLRRIAGALLLGVLIALFPLVVLLVRTGQNGFLIGGLTGLFLLAFQGKRAAAGIPLGLMILKPHLAAGIALLTLLGRRWGAAGIAALVAGGAILAATVAFGPGIWPAFQGGVREAGEFLTLGAYPLFRMTSIYACVKSLGGSAPLAFALHGLGAAAALGLFLLVWRGTSPMAFKLAAACAASLFVSPYNYDYDLAILGMALAFLAPCLARRASDGELAGLCALFWFATGYGIVMDGIDQSAPSLIAPVLIALIGWGAAILRRPESAAFEAEPPAGALRAP